MDLEALAIFRAVAAELSITKAATQLGRVPSNVTTRIQQLEAELRVQLFVRTGKRLSLSSAGQLYRGYADRILTLADEGLHAVSGGAHGGTLRIGSMESTAASRLAPVLARLSTDFPDTRLHVTTSPSRQLLQQVQSGQLDCALLALLSTDEETPEELASMGLEGTPVWDETLLLLMPTTEQSVRSPKDIGVRTLAAFAAGCTYRAIAEEALAIPGAIGWRVQEMGSYHGMIACVAAGASVAVLPRSVAELTPLPETLASLELMHKTTWLIRRRDYNVPAFANLLARVEDHKTRNAHANAS